MSEDFKGERKKYYLDRMVNSKSETIRVKVEGGASVGRSFVSVRSTLPREVKVEISVAWVAG